MILFKKLILERFILSSPILGYIMNIKYHYPFQLGISPYSSVSICYIFYILYSILHTSYSIFNTPCSILHIPYSIFYIWYSIFYILYSIFFIFYILSSPYTLLCQDPSSDIWLFAFVS